MVLLLGPASAAAGCSSTGMSPFFTPSLCPLQFLLFKCVLQALEGLRNMSQHLHCNWQMISESLQRHKHHTHILPPPGFTLLFAALDVLEEIIRCWVPSIVGLSAIDDSPFPIQVHTLKILFIGLIYLRFIETHPFNKIEFLGISSQNVDTLAGRRVSSTPGKRLAEVSEVMTHPYV